ncbi:MAG: T9SS type A sorting domain-containing protein [Bacteroidales bacterium]|jgi:hypothetical protein|nr:T9SS type A sorting domain-containing protein [Bacteroidales bacterium]HOL98510.1 T9SS type A sorting domain-containing protein [Bacteroidales bacterium]HOM36126.1 T9SS type A sorting domain-containing protein [Bacteroidales bacterium]HPD23442.1 T9SS type A sorting domain-containing protein [Bacteroidales bacterium]HRS99574.1 T9SS type A sorting domain-containing protein [Bacteroidales bacterium]
MKRILLLVSSVAISIFSFGQFVTISGQNQIPQIGDVINYINCSDFGFEIGGTGSVTNKLWDYTGLMQESSVTFSYLDPSTVSGYEQFTDVNLAETTSGQNGAIFIKAGNYYMARKGITGDLYMNYANDSALLFKFPITAGQSFNNTYTGTFFASGLDMIIDNGNVQIQADAQGTLILPNGTTLTNVLRLHITETFSGKYDFGTGPMEIMSVNDDYYYWFHEDYKMPVMVYGITSVNSIGGNQQSKALRFQPIENTTDIVSNSYKSISVYPNPAKDIVNVISDINFDMAFIYDVTGKMVKAVNVINKTVDITDISAGIYSLELKADGQSFKTKIVVE